MCKGLKKEGNNFSGKIKLCDQEKKKKKKHLNIPNTH